MINCFFVDRSLYMRPTGAFADVSLGGAYGFANDYLKTYFKTTEYLVDNRTSRIDIGSGGPTLISTLPSQILFDELAANIPDLDTATSDEITQLFNIIERVLYIQDSIIDHNNLMTTDIANYGIYSVASLTRSDSTGTVDFYKNTTDASVQVTIRDWVMFTVTFATAGSVTFKLWSKHEAFTLDYPISSIEKIIYPGDPSRLVNVTYSSVTAAISAISALNFSQLSPNVGTKDCTGVYDFETAYNPGGIISSFNVSFSVLYKGRVPSNQEVRDAIKADLLSLNVASESVIKLVFPNLFTFGRFYMIPIFDNVTVNGPTKTPKSTLNYKRIKDLMLAIFADYDESFISTYLEVTQAASSELYIAVLPARDNDSAYLSLRGQHPTYIAVDTRNSAFNVQTDATKEFNITLSSCMAVLNGASNLGTFSTDSMFGRNFFTFVSSSREYYALKQESFPYGL